MKTTIAQGWKMTRRHLTLVLALFVYRLGWGIFLYRFIDDIISPLLRRYPSSAPTDYAVQVFLTEAQFQLFKTNLITPYVWMLAALFAFRMLLTPFIHSGLLYSLHQQFEHSANTHFREGMRKCWKPVTLIYWLEMALIAVPVWWLAPRAMQIILTSPSFAQLAAKLLPIILGWAVWAVAIHLLSLSMQLGAVSGGRIWSTLWQAIIKFLPFLLLSLVLWIITFAIAALFSVFSLLGAGFLAILLHQGSHLISTWMKVWTLSAQSHYIFSQGQG
ncbi:hypothetical protein [Paenibacillus sp. GXUN7292]|uniref:hypothetical protein n=1 Tax=Paenibacillus sp. GXUN7292 TaxID=3422499 RepID=UPI003D7CAB21